MSNRFDGDGKASHALTIAGFARLGKRPQGWAIQAHSILVNEPDRFIKIEELINSLSSFNLLTRYICQELSKRLRFPASG